MVHLLWFIHDHFITSFKCSVELAGVDLEAMEIYRENITTAATNKCFNAALLAGLISQQSRGGALLDQNGTMPCSNTADGLCYGIMGMKNGMHHSLIHRLCCIVYAT